MNKKLIKHTLFLMPKLRYTAKPIFSNVCVKFLLSFWKKNPL